MKVGIDDIGRFMMSLILGDALSRAIAELSRRKVKLCHACQLSDFKSYLQLGGIPSRNLLETKGLRYTAFDTDDSDRGNGVWKLVFFNLSDFGHWFAQGKSTVPNPFGPILLCFDPGIIRQAVDVSIALRSAGARDFDRVGEGIGVEDVPHLFKDADSQHVCFAQALREKFGCQKAQSPEISCSFRDELAPFSHLAYIIVDPYSFPSGTLLDTVCGVISEYNGPRRVFMRLCADGCEARYAILLNLIRSGIQRASDLKVAIPDSSLLSAWRGAVLAKSHLTFQFGRYVRYLSEGTLSYISSLSRR
jgi:hypothetical protein